MQPDYLPAPESFQKLISNHYRLVQSLGRGSFGQVFLAEDTAFDPPRRVAVKILHPEFLAEPGLREDIKREASVLARFNHPNILRVLEFKVTPELAYIVTDLAEGGSLANKLRPDPSKPPVRFPFEVVTHYLEQLADALDEAHSQGLIHRDIKPLNILLDRRGRPLVADFGLATALSHSQSSVLVEANTSGTPPYMAPEQWLGQAGKASDIYALGVMVYQMVTGQQPYQGGQFELMGQHLNSPVPPLSYRAPDLPYPPALDQVMAGVMAKDPRQRTRPALEFARQFKKALNPLPPPFKERLDDITFIKPLEVKPVLDQEKTQVAWVPPILKEVPPTLPTPPSSAEALTQVALANRPQVRSLHKKGQIKPASNVKHYFKVPALVGFAVLATLAATTLVGALFGFDTLWLFIAGTLISLCSVLAYYNRGLKTRLFLAALSLLLLLWLGLVGLEIVNLLPLLNSLSRSLPFRIPYSQDAFPALPLGLLYGVSIVTAVQWFRSKLSQGRIVFWINPKIIAGKLGAALVAGLLVGGLVFSDQGKSADTLSFQGNLLAGSNKVEKAADKYRAAIKLDPSNPFYHANLGNVLSRTNDLGNAENEYKETVRLLPDAYYYWQDLAEVQERQGENTEAETTYKKVIALQKSPYYSDYRNLGSIQVKLGKYAEAEMSYKKVIEVDSYPSSNEFIDLGQVQIQEGKYQEAAVNYEKGASKASSYDKNELLLKAGTAYEKAGNYSGARQVYQAILSDSQAYSSDKSMAQDRLKAIDGK